MKQLLTFLSLTILFFSAAGLQPAFSANLSDQINQQVDASSNKAGVGDSKRSPQAIAVGLIKSALSVFGMIFLVLVVYGGFTIFLARGESDKVESGLHIIRTAMIGLGIVLAAYSISYAVGKIIEKSI